MKIRRFKNSLDQVQWKRWTYVEYQDGELFSQGFDGGFKPTMLWSLAEAERLVANGSWIELKPRFSEQRLGDWPEDWTHENGCYCNICSVCHARFLAHKRRVVCKCCDRQGVVENLVLPRVEIAATAAPAKPVVGISFTELRIDGTVYIPKPDLADIPTIRDMKLYEFFQEFRYAKVTVLGMGDTYNRATAYIDAEIRSRIETILKGKP